MTAELVYCVQDSTGTAAQLTLAQATHFPVEVGDTGTYIGRRWDGQIQSLNFTVGQVLDALNFGITTMTPTGAAGTVLASGWSKSGTITWLTGENSGASPNETVVVDQNPANAYTSVTYFNTYCNSRGMTFPASPIDAVLQALVLATDYIDQRYRFKGIKLFQFLTDNPAFDPIQGMLDPWLLDFGILGGTPGVAAGGLMYDAFYTPSYTTQHTEWPRQGVVDFNGDNVYGVPLVVQQAVCEGAWRQLNGTNLQPDYDPDVVAAGAIVQMKSEQVGPIHVSTTYDTKLGTGFFPSIPKIDRMLRNAGVLVAGGGRSIIR